MLPNTLRSWLRPTTCRPRTPRHDPRSRQHAARLRLELLEDRTTPSIVDLLALGSVNAPVNGAFFSNAAYGAGTGVIDSFVRIRQVGNEQGFNSSAPVNKELNEANNYNTTFNRALPLSSVPIAYIYNAQTGSFDKYLEFRLDINENDSNNGDQYLSLDALQIYQSSSSTLHEFTGSPISTGTFNSGGTSSLRYNLDAGGDSVVLLNYDLQSGSGVGDMSVFVPASAFDPDQAYVYLYSAFGFRANETGHQWDSSDGFEEWSIGRGLPIAASDLTGVKFNDVNQNGTRDGGEPGLAGWTIYLDQNQNNQLDWVDGSGGGTVNGVWDAGEGERWTTTDATGTYVFSSLAAGLGAASTYHVRELNNQAGWTQSAPLNGTYPTGVGTETSTVSSFTITVEIKTAGETYHLPGFGNWSNRPPTGEGGSFDCVDPGEQVTGNVNGSDPDGNTLSYALTGAAPLYGTASVNAATGAYSYTAEDPATWPAGHPTDSFQVLISDGHGGTKTVTVTVELNRPPTAGSADLGIVAEGSATTTGVLVGDPDGDTLTVTITQGLQGTVTYDPATRKFTYTASATGGGDDSFSYTVSDDCETVSGMVTVHVNRPPTGRGGSFDCVDPGETVGGDVNGDDPDGDTLSYSISTDPLYGTASVDSDGNYSYTADDPASWSDPHQADSFQVLISDGHGGTKTVTINVELNLPPDAVDDGPYSVSHSATLTVVAPGVLGNDSDDDGDTLTITDHTEPGHGTLDLHADGSFVYTPDGTFVGTDSFTYTISDGCSEDTATVTITVTNRPPTGEGGSFDCVDPGEQVTGNVNGSDPDGDTLSFALTGAAPLYGTASVDAATGAYSYTADDPASWSDPHPTDSFQILIDDGHGGTKTVTVNVELNLPPDAVDDAGYSVSHAATLTVAAPGVLGNDSDPDGDTPVITGHTSPSHGTLTLNPDGSFSYDPDDAYVGPDSFTYTISDECSEDTATVYIDVTNNPPVGGGGALGCVEPGEQQSANDGVGTPTGDGHTVDDDGDVLTHELLVAPTYGSVSVDPDTGDFTYTAPASFPAGHPAESFTIRVSDPFGASVDVVVDVELNLAPNAVNDSYNTLMNVAKSGNVLANDSDPDLVDTVFITGHTAPAHGTLVFDDATGAFTYTPNPGYTGPDSFTYTIKDRLPSGDECAESTATVSFSVSSNARTQGYWSTHQASIDAVLAANNLTKLTVAGAQYSSAELVAIMRMSSGNAVSNALLITFQQLVAAKLNTLPNSATVAGGNVVGGVTPTAAVLGAISDTEAQITFACLMETGQTANTKMVPDGKKNTINWEYKASAQAPVTPAIVTNNKNDKLFQSWMPPVWTQLIYDNQLLTTFNQSGV